MVRKKTNPAGALVVKTCARDLRSWGRGVYGQASFGWFVFDFVYGEFGAIPVRGYVRT